MQAFVVECRRKLRAITYEGVSAGADGGTKSDGTKPDGAKPDGAKLDDTKLDDTKPGDTEPEDTERDDTEQEDAELDGYWLKDGRIVEHLSGNNRCPLHGDAWAPAATNVSDVPPPPPLPSSSSYYATSSKSSDADAGAASPPVVYTRETSKAECFPCSIVALFAKLSVCFGHITHNLIPAWRYASAHYRIRCVLWSCVV